MLDCRNQQLIDGEWVDALGGDVADVVDPATEKAIASVPFGGAADAQAAIDAAATAFPAWSGKTAYQRADVLRTAASLLRERRDSLASVTTAESGKPLAESKGEWTVVADLFDWFAEEAKRAYGRTIPAKMPGRRLMTIEQPLGVVGVITAWNFPAYNPARSVAAALAAGCTVVCRPADETPLSAFGLGEALVDAGLPAGVVNVINGDPAAMAGAMMDDPRCRKMSFTGSTEVGRLLIRQSADTVTGVSLELGGNAPVIIEPDAIERAGAAAFAKTAVLARFRNAGQVCVAPQRFYVHRDVYDAFVEAATPLVAAYRVGPGANATSDIGPLINAAQRDRVERLLAEPHGGRVLAGGKRPADRPKGFFFEPTLVADVATDSALWREETFGPVLAVTPYDELDAAIADANALESGLAAFVFSHDLARATHAYERLEYGMVAVNGWVPHATEGPFTGWKQSGVGAESGPEGLSEYLETKLVSLFV
ncbi:Succinate-semialdehyde dehydrogenase [NADP(+)] GabD [Botrimarina colliarenosi]|uniref:Succinate-semialdehyde dehydrogenase [NADP(+)] GabD n=1 Tax=Botrimarina colliarenosi TaxID=2528001 RepID=A0A5C6AJS6_9BACT|nr:NAD-dependent succinate-semialdehyde dehydrogenase [Botrimarina colliarenosi]TWT99666.1 Succinate-semialdehyde dehydrogenase [NADP(+)] GabD [Botrimarina colliarenosi]